MNNPVEKLEKMFNDNLLMNTLLKGNKSMFQNVFRNIKKNISELDSEKEATKFDYDQVYKTIKFTRSILIDEPLSDTGCKFFSYWVYLVYNWNQNVLQDSELRDDCRTCTRLNENYLTMKEVMNNMKHLNKRLKEFKQWNPPAFEISKSFINYLDE